MSSLSREKSGDFLKDDPHAHGAANQNEATKDDKERGGVDLISFHGRIVSYPGGVCKGKQGET